MLYVVGIYLLITKMILLEKSGSGAGKPETGRTSGMCQRVPIQENEKAITVCSLQYDKRGSEDRNYI